MNVTDTATINFKNVNNIINSSLNINEVSFINVNSTIINNSSFHGSCIHVSSPSYI